MANRRLFLVLMLLGLAGHGMPAIAKDGDSGGGDGGGSGGGDDGGDGGSDDGGGDDDGGDRDNDRDDDRDDDDRDDDDHDDDRDDDDDKIRDAVRAGQAEPLRKILSSVRRKYKGEVVKIRLTGAGRTMQYRIRLIDTANRLFEVRVNAKSGRIIGTASP